MAARLIAVPDAFPALDYPGPWPDEPGLLGDGTYTPLRLDAGASIEDAVLDEGVLDEGVGPSALPDALRELGGAPMRGRTLVLAVGSNGDPAVLLRKLRAANVSPLVPMAPVRVGRLRAGHSAHVSPPGFLAAAPFRAADGDRDLIALWLDDRQLAAIDRTEPSYRRLRLDAQDHPVVLAASGFGYTSADVYESLRGVIHLGGVPVELLAQAELHAALRAGADGLSAIVPFDDPTSTVELLRDAAVRERVRDFLRDAGHAGQSGLSGREMPMSRRDGA